MIYIDKLLTTILSTQRESLIFGVADKDVRTLTSLANSANSDQFITENQSNLIIKLLKHYSSAFPSMQGEINAALASPSWSKPFRVIKQVRKLYVDNRFPDNTMLSVEFTFSTNLRKILTQANKHLDGLIQDTNGKLYHAELTERNIVTLVDMLAPLNFEIDNTVTDYYNTIKSWNKDEIKLKYRYDAITARIYETAIADDIGSFDGISDDIKQDRSMRYRYFSGLSLEDNGSLTRKISTRNRNRIWVNKKEHSLNDVFVSLVELQRAPVLVVFDSYNQTKAHEILDELSVALKNNNLDNDVGIYFRLPNTEAGTKFNKIIGDNHYNKFLTTDTQVVGVQSNKIPKFLLTSSWTPKSVIVIDSNLRSSKTAVYANGCDLIVTYADAEPLYDKSDTWA